MYHPNGNDDCLHLQRAIELLKSWDSLTYNEEKKEHHPDHGFLVQLFHEHHQSILNDYTHIVSYHEALKQTSKLYQQLKEKGKIN